MDKIGTLYIYIYINFEFCLYWVLGSGVRFMPDVVRAVSDSLYPNILLYAC